ncbi:MAG: hypothetical protein JSW03_05395 [Candidatus Eiseniibacteriota bacterium]|nr:MAG: hypothetical protein JSW03_05395 [Candidatus Eisenbacteria bacterium]
MKLKTIGREFTHHFPFSLFSASLGLLVVGLITAVVIGSGGGELAPADTGEAHGVLPDVFGRLFHVFHPVHILFSAIATTAMFWRFDRKLFKAVAIGLLGSLGVCGVSDILIPFVGGMLSGREMHLHLCVVEHASLVLPFAALGVVVGIIAARVLTERRSTVFSHSSHVLVSTMASLLYLVSFGFTNWMESILAVLAIVVIAVLIPCCTSDIVFPLLVASPEAAEHTCCAHGEGASRSTSA